MITTFHPLIPMRREASHKSEQVSQLLFGEKAELMDQVDSWAYIRTIDDDYTGWTELRSVHEIEDESLSTPVLTVAQPLIALQYNGSLIHLPAGSELPVDTLTGEIVIEGEEFTLPSDEKDKPFETGKTLTDTACRFLNAPYQWGGRTILGFDCSGFSQLIFKLHGIHLPRDAKDQATAGTPVEFIQEALPGDLVFFDNEDGLITHVGIYLGENRIIHASVSVHIDRLDQQGIFNLQRKEYSHKLRLIKRIEM